MKKILLIGGTNLANNPLGGEEFKNQLIYSYLSEKYNTKLVDTHGWRKNPFILMNLFFQLFFKKFDRIIISITTNSAYKLLKVIYFFPGLYSKAIYFVIGGNFPRLLASESLNIKYYQKLYHIIVEGIKLKKELNSCGLNHNVMFLPNFKPVNRVYLKEQQRLNNDKFRFVFVSSIIHEKGVTLILEAVEKLSLESDFAEKFTVDFWGPFESEQYKYFFEQAISGKEYCLYKGYLNIFGSPHESYSVLSEYDCFLFPTFYRGEGFPGVLLDASIAGLPVIASNWNMNSEIITDGKNGLIIETNNVEALSDAMKKMMLETQMVDEMRINSNRIAFMYDMNKLLVEYLDPII